MKVEVRKEPASRVVLEVELPPEDVQKGVDQALDRLNRRVTIPGFRRGRAPKVLLQRYVGKEAVYEEAVNLLVPDAYANAVDQAGVRPITRPQIQVDAIEDGKPLRFVATVDLVPEVSLGDYRAIRVPPEPAAVTDADVDAAIEDLRRRHAQLVPLGERPAAAGDFVLVRTAEASGDQVRFLPGKEYLIELGAGIYPEEVEQALAGVTAGERTTVTTLDPASTVTFQVTDLKRKELPDLTDEFAKTAAKATSVQELRDVMRARMQQEVEARANEAHEAKVVDALLQSATIDVPASLVDHELQHLVTDLAESLSRRGLTMQRYLEATEKTEQQLLDELRPAADRRVRTQLAVDEFSRAERVEPTQEEIDREVENVARRLQLDDTRVREWLDQQGRYDTLVTALRRQQALARLVAIARGDAA
ncbi:MAG: trigger factor [Armatimonadetes bacterium]|nr:trigger factor [Armatimonadota bacterium]